MNKNKIISDNQLRKAFKNIPLENLPSDFMENMMSKIEKETIKRKRKKILIASLQIAAGIASMFLLPILVIYLCNLYIPDFSFSFTKMNINFNPNFIAIGLAVLMLLIIDNLYRKHITKEKTR